MFSANNIEFCQLDYGFAPDETKPNKSTQLCIMHENMAGKDAIYYLEQGNIKTFEQTFG